MVSHVKLVPRARPSHHLLPRRWCDCDVDRLRHVFAPCDFANELSLAELWGMSFPEPYMTLFNHSSRAVKDVDPVINIGGPGA